MYLLTVLSAKVFAKPAGIPLPPLQFSHFRHPHYCSHSALADNIFQIYKKVSLSFVKSSHFPKSPSDPYIYHDHIIFSDVFEDNII